MIILFQHNFFLFPFWKSKKPVVVDDDRTFKCWRFLQCCSHQFVFFFWIEVLFKLALKREKRIWVGILLYFALSMHPVHGMIFYPSNHQLRFPVVNKIVCDRYKYAMQCMHVALWVWDLVAALMNVMINSMEFHQTI